CNVEIECRPIRIVSLELNGAKFVARRVRRQVNSEIGRGSSRKSRWKSAAKRESGRKRKVGQIEGSGAEVRNGEGLAWRRAPNCDTAKVPGCRAIGDNCGRTFRHFHSWSAGSRSYHEGTADQLRSAHLHG